MRLQVGSRRRRFSLHQALVGTVAVTVIGLLFLSFRFVDPSIHLPVTTSEKVEADDDDKPADINLHNAQPNKTCATVEEMGQVFSRGFEEEGYRVRKIIENHFAINGAARVRGLPPEEFCRHGFVLGKASEAGFGNEMGRFPFEEFISYSNVSFTLKEIKHLWRVNGCLTKYRRHLDIRIDDFQKPTRTNVLCSNWRAWEQPIIW
ncbi:hypothetical protein BC332_04962 [Capsicum chinense]|nr:hypothetical protein BC332_04962 [Capsicum chinense]